MTDRDAILQRIGDGSSGSTPLPDPPKAWAGFSQGDVWKVFVERLQALGGRIVEPSDLTPLLDKPVWVDEDALALVSGSPWLLASDVWEAEAGITLADLGIAETGSLLLSAGKSRCRLASLAPPIHVALLRKDAIVGTLEEAVAVLPSRTSVLITGPSRTADIEGVLVRGVHGPKEVWVLPI